MTGLLASGVSPAAAIARREEARWARRQALEQLVNGEVDLQGLVVMAIGNEDIGNLRISKVLASLGWDKVRTEETLKLAGIAPTRRLRWLLTTHGLRHCEAFYELVAHRGRPAPPPEWVY